MKGCDAMSAPEAGSEASARDPVTVLIVDDFDDGRDLYGDFLAFKGFRVLTASNGPEAIEVAQRDRPSMILLDIRMPGMSGVDVSRLLRADSRFSKTLIVAVTAHAMPQEHEEIRAAGFDDIIAKPCLPDELLRKVQQLMARRRSARRIERIGRTSRATRTSDES
jgi:two-component system cell cycle response regulator DivK